MKWLGLVVNITIKDGIIYNAKQLLADVIRIMDIAKEAENFSIVQPGMKN